MNYERQYHLLILKGLVREQTNPLQGYYETHHILPRCQDGTDDPSNLVDLTPEEHFLAHLLLLKMNPGHYGLSHAVAYMSGEREADGRRFTNKLYGWARREISASSPGHVFTREEIEKARQSRLNDPLLSEKSRRGARAAWAKKTEEQKKENIRKMTAASVAAPNGMKGRTQSQEAREAVSLAHKGKKKSETHRARISSSLRERAIARMLLQVAELQKTVNEIQEADTEATDHQKETGS